MHCNLHSSFQDGKMLARHKQLATQTPCSKKRA